MLHQVYHILRSKQDGQYIAAHPDPDSPTQYLLLFSEYADALSYLNKYAQELVDRFTVESISGTQLKGILQRWSFAGIGLVKDPLLPRIEFLGLD
ncbi:MAG: hypothetical protein HC835_18260 [Oscillatoriales cyanobacterium RM2_1_1]|nr:hypothetical protein [Oscillatoriales cyanobacterium SM2_3_0]NJO47397.1 hypothetical protein [Oscillatoriales cyanobacterium RM2_1_1]